MSAVGAHPMSSLTFSAFGHRWRVQRLRNEPVPGADVESLETGLYFESDTAAARFLPVGSALLPAEGSLADVPFEQWRELLGWSQEIDSSR